LTQDIPLDDAAGSKGDPDAPVVVVEYSDYQCPFCQRHFAEVLPQIQPYIDDGTVLYVFKDFPLTSIHPQAPKAAEAARCAGDQEAYWPMHDLLFQNQQQWSGQATAVDIFKGYAGQLGLDQATFDQCLDSGQHAAAVEANLQEGLGYGVRGTPAFFINRTLLPGAYPIEAFQQLIQEALAQP
jgi:protein-disulfide isomerase